MNICETCGHPNRDDKEFCDDCGSRVFKVKPTQKEYEAYLNDLYYGTDLNEDERYVYLSDRAFRLLRKGKLGTALRKYDPIAFNVGFGEWKGDD
jgi:DNA-directed RNA polymerase subunit RPC12/RpoP